MALEGTIKTPFGPMQKKTAAIGGVGAAGVIGIVWWRSRQNAASAASSTTSTDTTGTDTSGIDPATGIPYADEGDQSGIDPATGIPYADEQTGSASSVLGYDAYGNPIYGAGVGTGLGGINTGGTGPGSFTSNAEWAQYAEDYLVNTVGSDAATVGNALGKYITGGQLDAAQAQIVDQAIAFAQYPPTAGPGGFPPSLRTSPGGGGGTPKAHNPVTGLKVINQGNNSLSIGWNPSSGAKSYKISGAGQTRTISGTYVNLTGLRPDQAYTIKVQANPLGTGKVASIHARTSGSTGRKPFKVQPGGPDRKP